MGVFWKILKKYLQIRERTHHLWVFQFYIVLISITMAFSAFFARKIYQLRQSIGGAEATIPAIRMALIMYNTISYHAWNSAWTLESFSHGILESFDKTTVQICHVIMICQASSPTVESLFLLCPLRQSFLSCRCSKTIDIVLPLFLMMIHTKDIWCNSKSMFSSVDPHFNIHFCYKSSDWEMVQFVSMNFWGWATNKECHANQMKHN